jgi:1-acyl-sn-glycerol-3-phosphate acyltransferase
MMVISGATQATYHPRIAQGWENKTLKAIPAGFQTSASPLTFGKCLQKENPAYSRTYGDVVIDVISNQFSHWRTNLKDVVVSPQDMKLIEKYINPNTAAIITTNHSQYFTDAQVDKRLAGKCFPKAFFMLAAGFFNPLFKPFLMSAHARPNNGGDEGVRQAASYALQGNGFLMKPEGGRTWTNDKIQDLLPGVYKISMEALKQSDATDKRPVYTVPIVYKYIFDGDVRKGLQENMAFIEKKMGLEPRPDLPLAERFSTLQINILQKLMNDLDKPESLKDIQLSRSNFFFHRAELLKFYEQQLDDLVGEEFGQGVRRVVRYEKLEEKYKKLKTGEGQKVYQKLRPLVHAFKYLKGFEESLYNSQSLTQEHLFEIMLRIIQGFELIDPDIPPNVPGPQRAYVRVGKPVDVRRFVEKGSKDHCFQNAEFLREVQTRMQDAMDDLNRDPDLRQKMDRYRIPNRLYDKPVIRLL